MLRFNVKEAKAGFFDRAVITNAVDKAAARNLFRQTSSIRLIAKRSMKKARQKKISELTPGELLYYRTQFKLWKEGKRAAKPKRPLVSSKPGEPPRVRAGQIKELLYNAFDTQTKSAVVGPAVFASKDGGGKAPGTLERGGNAHIGRKQIHIAPRPYMQPAFDKAKPETADIWKNSVTP